MRRFLCFECLFFRAASMDWRDGLGFGGEQGGDYAQGFDLLSDPLKIVFFLLQDLVNISHDASRH